MQHLYIHIGVHKTGTTALQRFLSNNRTWLMQKGICYPDIGSTHHYDLAHALTDGDPAPLRRELDRALKSGAPVALFSSEQFSRIPDALRAALGETAGRTRLILYVRRQDYFIQSLYQEVVKSPKVRFAGSLQEYMEFQRQPHPGIPPRWDWYALVSAWARAFGAEHLIVRPYEFGQFVGGTLFSDFLHVLNLTPDDSLVYPAPDESNISLDFYSVELLRRTNATRAEAEQARITDALGRIAGDGRPRRSPAGLFMTARARRDFLQTCEEGNARLAREFLGREDGRLFLDPWPADDEAGPPDRLDAEGAAQVLMKLIVHEGMQLERLSREVEDLRKATLVVGPSGRGRFRSRLLDRLDLYLARRSGLFDPDFYRRQYPDTAATGADPLRHYVRHGWREGRNPSARFHTLEFLQRHPGIARTGLSPIAFEAREGLAGWLMGLVRKRYGWDT